MKSTGTTTTIKKLLFSHVGVYNDTILLHRYYNLLVFISKFVSKIIKEFLCPSNAIYKEQKK